MSVTALHDQPGLLMRSVCLDPDDLIEAERIANHPYNETKRQRAHEGIDPPPQQRQLLYDIPLLRSLPPHLSPTGGSFGHGHGTRQRTTFYSRPQLHIFTVTTTKGNATTLDPSSYLFPKTRLQLVRLDKGDRKKLEGSNFEIS